MPMSAPQYSVEECSAIQREEWEVLESIFPDCVSSDLNRGSIRLEIPVELSEPRTVVSSDESTISPAISLSTLPPLLLDILLPPAYPFVPPEIISIHATHSWFPHLSALHRKLLQMWQEGEGVLYMWVEHIHSGDFMDSFGLTSSKDRSIRIPHRALLPLLISYDKTTQLSKFSNNSYTCEICMTSIKGARCILLSCSHVFCRACLEDFWGLCINEGSVDRVGCPDPSCVKEGREANEEEVRRVISEEGVRRWKWLREKRALEKDPTIIHCPLAFCQAPVPKPPLVEEGTGWERLRECSECGYSFCAYCRRTWHGTVTSCPLPATQTFLMEYMSLPPDSHERLLLERRYGKASLAKLVAKFEEEKALKDWLDESATACPGCSVHVEKSHGCNHMICPRCKMHFCYRCGAKLHGSNPYAHFSTPSSDCFNKLFDLQDTVDDGWQPVEGFDALED